MIPYASRTGTRRNLAALERAGFRLLVSAKGAHRAHGFRYAIDNGAWSAFQSGEPFDAPAFEAVIRKLGPGADWTVIPDIVEGGQASFDFSMSWLPRLQGLPLLLAVQDGITPGDLDDTKPPFGIFIGGSTEYKESSMMEWGNFCSKHGVYLHVGRVNTKRRIAMCAAAGVDSFDGTSATIFSDNAAWIGSAAKQLSVLRRPRLAPPIPSWPGDGDPIEQECYDELRRRFWTSESEIIPSAWAVHRLTARPRVATLHE